MKISAILIAAGLSSRMHGPNKLLETIASTHTLIERVYVELLNSVVDELIVVTGRDAERINQEIINLSPHVAKTKFVHNPNFEMGMTTSIQAGLSQVRDKNALMICLADMPLLTSRDYNDMLNTFRQHDDSSAILAPFMGAWKGNPVIFGSDYHDAIALHEEMNGCAGIIKANPSHLIKLKTTSEHFFYDIDTPEALKEFKTRAQ